MGDLATWVCAVAAIGSLVVSGIALVKSARAQRQANQTQERLVEIEERREQDRQAQARQAILRPKLRGTERGGHRLYLVNSGRCEARNIRVEMDDTPFAEHPAAAQNDPMPSLVGPGGEISALLCLTLDCAPPFKIRITWDDDFGTNRTYSTTLTM